MLDKLWIKVGLIFSVIGEAAFFLFTYAINQDLPENVISQFPFPSAIFSLIIVFVITFGLGALVGFLIEKFK